MDEEKLGIELSKKEWRALKLDAADISCWFMGFNAAKPEGVKLPPGLEDFENRLRHIFNTLRL